MNERSGRALDRLGAVSGAAAVLLLLALFTVLPALPAPNKPIVDIAESAKDNTQALLWGAYLGALFTGALLVFGAAVAARLRRRDTAGSGWWIVALLGAGATSIGIVADAVVITLVRAVGHGANGTALWVGYGTDHWLGTLVAVPIAIFLIGAGLGARESGALPGWLSWLAIVLAPIFLIGAASVTGDEVDGGPLGLALLLAYVGLLVWIAGSSYCLMRGSRRERAEAAVAAITAAR